MMRRFLGLCARKEMTCPTCGGSGWIGGGRRNDGHACPQCGGSGTVYY